MRLPGGSARRLPLILSLGLLPLLLLADLAYRETSWPLFDSPLWDTGQERSIVELLGYAQCAVAAWVVHRTAVRGRRGNVLHACALLLALTLADDSLQLHERGGAALTAMSSVTVSGVGTQDLGELAVWGALLCLPAALAVVGWRRSTPVEQHRSLVLAGLFVALSCAAVGVDVLHSSVTNAAGQPYVALAYLEAGGELLCLSLLCTYALAVRAQDAPGAAGDDPSPTASTRPADLEDTDDAGRSAGRPVERVQADGSSGRP